MADLVLRAEKRSIFGKKLGRERRTGKLPAILYGHGIQNVPLFLSQAEFQKVFSRAGENTIVKVEIKDPETQSTDVRPALIHDVSRGPVSGKPLHTDLYQIRTDEKVRVAVPLVFTGESPAVKSEGGILVKTMQELEVEAFPQHLPPEIQIDISGLKSFEDKIYVKDLKIPAGLTILADQGATVALVQPPRSEEELKALEEKPVEAVEEVKVEVEEKKVEEEGAEGEKVVEAPPGSKEQSPSAGKQGSSQAQ